MEIGVIGAGYVGLTTAACLAAIGYTVYCAEAAANAEALNPAVPSANASPSLAPRLSIDAPPESSSARPGSTL